MRAAALSPIALAVLALAQGGCGSASNTVPSGLQGREKDAAQAVDDLRKAASRRDARKICDSYLTPELKASLATLARTTKRGSDCADQLKDSLQDADSLDLEVEAVRITGNTATVRVKTNATRGDDPVDTLHLVDQRGWRIDRLGDLP